MSLGQKKRMIKSCLIKRYTRFRAYQLGAEGSSFSYYDGSQFTLIEARMTDVNRPHIYTEMKKCGTLELSCLHITSWDADHCARSDLEEILEKLKPNKIEYPGYAPHTENAKECLNIIKNYKNKNEEKVIKKIDPSYIQSLKNAETWGYRHILFHPKFISEESNNNSTVKLFRTGSFNVASMGDVESQKISSYLKTSKSFSQEIDIMILAHHGADNGFTTNSFLKTVRPTIAVCSSNYDNQFEHPKKEIRSLLNKYRIPIYTTKTGDVVIVSLPPHTKQYKVFNLISNSHELSCKKVFITKKSKKLDHNRDTVNNIYKGNKNPFKKFF